MSFFDMLLAQKLSGNGGGGGGSAVDFSTSEQGTGIKWIDGNEIYMITFDKHESPVSGSGTIADVSALGIGVLLEANITAVLNNQQLPQGSDGRCAYIDGTNLKYYATSGKLHYCTIWYTKASSAE